MNVNLQFRKIVALICGLLLAASVDAQTVTKVFRDVPLKAVLGEIEAQTGYSFIFEDEKIHADRLVTASFEKATIQTVLDKVLDKSVRYSIKGKLVTISQRETPAAGPAAGKTQTVSGTVISSADNQPIAGVSILVEGTTVGVLTDTNGNYTLKIPAGAREIVFQFLGYETKRILVKDIQLMKLVSLNEQASSIENIVVVGFGVQKKESVVGAVQAVKPSTLDFPSSNLTASFAGKIAGVIATQKSGEPGADGANFWIRGISTFGSNNSPLIVMDGVEITTEMLNSIAPETIESFSVLKDATATALYGSRGANGVMLITTKSGRDLERMLINIRVENGWSMPTSVQKIADGVTFMEAYNEAAGTMYYPQDKIDGTREKRNPYIYPNNDWYKLLFKNYTMNQNVNANVTGGGKRVDYFLNATFYNENGILDSPNASKFNTNVNYQKYLFQSNISAKITSTTRLSLKMNTQLHYRHAPVESLTNLFYYTMRANPVRFPATWPGEEGDTFVRYGNAESPNGGSTDLNPYALMCRGFSDYHKSYYTATLNLDQDLKFVTPGLKIKGQASFYNYAYAVSNKTIVPHYYKLTGYEQDPATGAYTYTTSAIGPTGTDYYSVSSANFSYREMSFQGSLEYTHNFNDAHDVNALLVYHQKERVNHVASSSETEVLPYREQGLAGRVTYAYKNRYLFEANFGYNGSENFASGKRFGFFPSVAVGYNISQEPYFKPLTKVVSLLKLRFSYGKSGNDALAIRFPYVTEIASNQWMHWYLGSKLVGMQGTTIATLGNPDATWEVSTKTNYGLELGLFNDFTLIVDVFNEERTGIFMQRRSIPASSGYTGSLPYANIGAVKNRGVDLSFEYNKAFNKDWILSLRGSFTYAHNEITERDEPMGIPKYQSEIGHPINSIMGLVADGLFIDQADINRSPKQTYQAVRPGDVKYLDLNGDGQIDDNDKTILGRPNTPEIVYGFGASVKFKRFDFSVFFQGQGRVSLLMSNMHPFCSADVSGFGMTQWIADEHWSESNPDPNAAYPRLSAAWNQNNTKASSLYVRNGSFLRLKSIEVGYTLKQFRFYFTGSNLATISGFDYWDPELRNKDSNGNILIGTNGLTYPLQRTFNLGVQYNF